MSALLKSVVVVVVACCALAPLAAAQSTEPEGAPSAGPATTAPAEKPSELEALDASLVADEEPAYPRLQLYGFADFTYSKYFIGESSPLSLYLPPRGSFAIGNINAYLDSQISEHLRSLIEVRFSFLPNGAPSVNTATGQIIRTNTQVNDYRIQGRNTQWGSIGIERVVISYDFFSWLSVSAGRFITPWGLWNIDHGSPTVINVITPLFVESQFIPTRQTGLHVSGSLIWPSLRAGYHLTLSNGRGPVDTYRDFDKNTAVGGRLFLTVSWLGELTLGTTFYFGRDTDPKAQFVRLPSDGSQAYVETRYRVSSRERALAADLKWEWKGTLLISEFVATGRAYDDDGRAVVEQAQSVLVSDGRRQIAADALRYGGYVLLGHRFDWLGTMPFVNFEYSYSSDQPVSPRLWWTAIGLNVRPLPGLVLKATGSLLYFKDADERFFGKQPRFFAINTQIAWAF